MGKLDSMLMGLVVFAIMAGVLLPIAFTDLTAFTSTDATVQSLVSSTLPVMIAVALVVGVIHYVRTND